MAACENRWMVLYNFSTYRLSLPFLYFSVFRLFNWNVVGGQARKLRARVSKEVLTSAARPRAPHTSSHRSPTRFVQLDHAY